MGDQWKPSWDNRIGFVHNDETSSLSKNEYDRPTSIGSTHLYS